MAQAVSQNLESWQAKLDKSLHEKNAFTDILQKVEDKTGVRRLYLCLGLGAFLGLYLMVGYGAQFLCNFIGFLYPAYASVKAIESTVKEDDTKWLTYWVVYSFFSLIEFFTDIFLFWIPFYWFIKCVFLFYCMVPTTWNGSIMIYNNVIRPFILKHQTQIDQTLDKAADAAQGVLNEVANFLSSGAEKAEEAAKDAAAEAVRKGYAVDSSKTD